MNKRDIIKVNVKDLVSDLLYYDRKEDEDLPVGAIEESVAGGEITADEIVGIFRTELAKSIPP